MKLLTPTEVIESIKDGKQVEYTYGNEKEWCEFKPFDFTIENLLDEYYSFRLAQEMITIGDVSFPKPETEPLAQGITYYTPDIGDIYAPYKLTWINDNDDQKFLQYGIVHLTDENAIAHAKALIKLSGGSYE